MSRGTLGASEKGIEIAKTALNRACLTQKALAEELGIARSTVSKFFNGRNVDRYVFIDTICHRLSLDWNEIVQRPESPKLIELKPTQGSPKPQDKLLHI